MNKEELSAQRAEKWREELRRSRKAKERTDIPRVKMKELDPAYRITNREEVNCGLTREQAVLEATRCLDCVEPLCMTGCPVGINIPKFIKNIERGDFFVGGSYVERNECFACGVWASMSTGTSM